MADLRVMQTNFSAGVQDPAIKARLDIQNYYDGCLIGDNVDFKPIGGAAVRGGLRYRAQAEALDARLIPFIFNRDNKYLLEFTNLKMRVFLASTGALQTNLNGSGNDYITTAYTTAQTDQMDFTQAYNTMLLFHEDVAPQLLTRGGSHTTWTIGTHTFEEVPQVDFDDATSPAPTTHDVQITFTGVWAENDHYKLELNGFETPEIIYSADTTANARRIKEELLLLPPTGFRDAGITVTHISGVIYRIQLSGDSADAYEPITGFSGTTAASKITESTRTTVGVSRREDCISASRGWPRCGSFYESRLWMGGLKSLPEHELGSVVGDFFSLRVGEGFDDEAIFQPIQTDQFNGIEFLHPGRHLQAFTAGGEFYHPARPLTPDDSGRPRQTRYGSGDTKPVEVDGATIFITRSNKTLREFLFVLAEESYNADSLSLLAADPLLTSGIVGMAARSGASDDESSYVYCPTGDGNCAVLNTLRSQSIIAWSRYTTTGAGGVIKRVAVVDDEVFFLVHRTINSVEVPYIEQLDPTVRTDSAITGTQASSTTITGLNHLIGEAVRVLGDGLLLPSVTVDGSGNAEVARAVTSYQVGLDYNPDLRSLPLNVDLGDGPMLGLTKSLQKLYVLVKNTNGLIASFDTTNDPGEPTFEEEVDPQWVLDSQKMDQAAAPISGTRVFNLDGWTEGDAIIRLLQRDPLPFHVLGFVALVDIGGD